MAYVPLEDTTFWSLKMVVNPESNIDVADSIRTSRIKPKFAYLD